MVGCVDSIVDDNIVQAFGVFRTIYRICVVLLVLCLIGVFVGIFSIVCCSSLLRSGVSCFIEGLSPMGLDFNEEGICPCCDPFLEDLYDFSDYIPVWCCG